MPSLIVDANGLSWFVDESGFTDIVDDAGNFFDATPADTGGGGGGLAELMSPALDFGLNRLTTDAHKFLLCNALPTDYADAVTKQLAVKDFAAGSLFGAPGPASPNGRKVISVQIANGLATANGTVTHWAITDGTGVLLARGPVVTSQSVAVGNNFAIPSFSITIPS